MPFSIQTNVNSLIAQENLRVIRDLMERSTKYSTFSGLSGGRHIHQPPAILASCIGSEATTISAVI